MQLHLKM
jgi:hypothetical protein